MCVGDCGKKVSFDKSIAIGDQCTESFIEQINKIDSTIS